ncbi:hypothetical protein GCM10009430_31270 [Aquimarina litoralis]|uniref:Uncharacterized protein n=1 Tax=Aquimarina litoralis TaxID=584605 RepID=A0ABP3U6M4_9FLAO
MKQNQKKDKKGMKLALIDFGIDKLTNLALEKNTFIVNNKEKNINKVSE